MKKMNKYAAFLLAATMTMGMSSTVFADTAKTYDTSNLTIDTVSGHTYKVYQLLKGDVSDLNDEVNNGSGTLSNIVAGQNLKSGTTTDAFVAAVKDQSGSTLGDTAWSYVSGDPVKSVAGVADDTTTEKDESLVTVEVTDGYYVVQDTASDGSIISRYMVAVVGDTSMAPKNSSVPTVVKKVKDTNDSVANSTTTWQDSADYDIGDSIPYQLTATLPSDYADYHTYYLSFNDELSDGLTLQASTIVVKVGDTVLDDADYYIYGTQNKFQVVIYDLKALTDVTATASTQVTVEYSATLNSKAVIGSEGNENTVNLTYNNNPNITTKDSNADGTPDDNYPKPGDKDTPGTPDAPKDEDNDGKPDEPDSPDNPGTPGTPSNPGTTPDDTNIVFTYKVDVNKIKADKSALAGAAFELLKYDADSKEYKSLGIQNATKNDDGTYTLTNDATTSFEWKGIDDGQYKIVEVITPEGYNTLADQEFTVEATHETTADDPKLTSLTATTATGSTISFSADTVVDENKVAVTDKAADGTTINKYVGSLTSDIVNQAGTVLPSTGGIGTTIFYVSGLILVLGAGILLVSRRRIAR